MTFGNPYFLFLSKLELFQPMYDFSYHVEHMRGTIEHGYATWPSCGCMWDHVEIDYPDLKQEALDHFFDTEELEDWRS